MRRQATGLALSLLVVGCGSGSDARSTSDASVARVAPPSTSDPAPAAPTDTPRRHPLSYLPPDVRLVGQLDLKALLDSPARRGGFLDGFASGSPRLEAHAKAIESCLGGAEALDSVTFGSPSVVAPILVVRGKGVGTPEVLRCYTAAPGIAWTLGEDPTRFSLGSPQAWGYVAGPDTIVLTLDHPESPILERIIGHGDSLLDRPENERPALDDETRQGPLWVSLLIDDQARPQLAGTPASTLRRARCRGDLEDGTARAVCRFELDPHEASSLATALSDPDGPTGSALAAAGIPTESLEATVSGESLTVSLELPLASLP